MGICTNAFRVFLSLSASYFDHIPSLLFSSLVISHFHLAFASLMPDTFTLTHIHNCITIIPFLSTCVCVCMLTHKSCNHLCIPIQTQSFLKSHDATIQNSCLWPAPLQHCPLPLIPSISLSQVGLKVLL